MTSLNKTDHTPTLFLCAGEPSGDLLGAELVNALKKQHPHWHFRGMGSDKMQAAGVELVINSHDLAIMGLSEAIQQLPKIRRVMKKIEADLIAHRPDMLILIDYPGFNLRLAKIAKKYGITVFYYSCPQIWAWHYSRIKKIKKYIHHMLTLFPFEQRLYQKENMPATFVGHPMVQRIQPHLSKAAAYEKYELNPNKPIIALLPGSRKSEIKKLLPDMLKAVELIWKTQPSAQVILPLADNLNTALLHEAVADQPALTTVLSRVRIIRGHRYDALQCADVAIAVSGTVTLELALMQIPMMIIYRVSALTYQVGKLLLRSKHFGLCNIVAEKEIAKEALQKAVSPENIANEMLQLLNNLPYRETILSMMKILKEQMGEMKAADQAASVIAKQLPTG